ncbi:MAG: cytochrome c biogenesis protein CcsA [Chitinophagales bacterium]|nr:cytochrome c biogenesis protein CcsA [Chitinophagales bacterium]
MREFSNNFYLNENLFFGHLGELLIILAFVSALFTFLLGMKYYLSKERFETDLRQVRIFFWIHLISVLGIFFLLIFLFKGQYFEYHYVWRHSSKDLPWYYILSAMWEGQEGSFILWLLWQAILGYFLMRKTTEIKVGALAILMFIQVLLLTMILGVDVFGKLIGMNPFILLRDEMNIPILSNPNYLSLIKDGNGLNILLQNYWMVIHPPVLFLGFASASIPFSFALASLLKKDYIGWTKEVNSWTLFSVAALGAGILMGGRWAYEALSFGGFWAWDPVENASLVPWLFLVAGLHTLLIYKATGHSLKASYILLVLGFGFVLYSTFLTRSGILGDSSVHSFTDLGMTGQLLVFLALLLIPVFLLLAFNWSRIPDIKEEEHTKSREFWMFLGVLFIVVSAIQVSFTTSIPVWNKLFDFKEKLAPPVNANEHYNSIQIWFTTIVCALMAFSLWLQYKVTKGLKKIKVLGIVFLGCFVITGVHLYLCDILPFQEYVLEVKSYKLTVKFISTYLLLFLSSLTMIAWSIYYIVSQLRNSNKLYWGGSIAHIGFGLLVIGALISQYQKQAISLNKAGFDLGKEFSMEEQSSNTLLMKNKREAMGKYWVTYIEKSNVFKGEKYKVLFQSQKDLSDSFVIYPEAKIIKEGENNRLNPEPGIKNFWNKDIFSHVSSVPDDTETKDKASIKKVKIKDTFYTGNRFVVLDKVTSSESNSKEHIEAKASLRICELNGAEEPMEVFYKLSLKSRSMENPIAISKDGQLKINIATIVPELQEFHFAVQDSAATNDWIILKVLEFPYIQILWLGCILMVIGTLMSMMYRRKFKK